MGAIEKIKSFPATKQEQQDFSREILQQVSDGVINPLHVKVWMKSIQDAFEMVLKNDGFEKLLLDEADKYSAEKRFLILNAECEITSRTTYDFSKDSKWVKLNEDLKAREKLLKAVQPGKEVADTDTGEILSCPVKGTSRYLKIKL